MSEKREAAPPTEEAAREPKKAKVDEENVVDIKINREEESKAKADSASSSIPDLQLDPEEAPDRDLAEEHEKLTTATIILFGLHPLATKAKLEKFLEPYGATKRVDVKMAFSSKYGLAEFEKLEDAQATLESLNGRKILGKELLVKGEGTKSQPRTDITA